jgi:predicted DNA-binding transcriptional regulator YafY
VEVDRDPTARALTLLSLLQSRPQWAATELAVRLGTSVRTVRRDAHRLRRLGYTIQARPGPGSTYQLVPGLSIPPLLFTSEEVTAIVTGLRLIHTRLHDDASAGALAKLDQVLPINLRRRAAATDLATEVLDDAGPATAAAIGAVADAVADDGRIRFMYVDQRGRSSTRLVEPYRHVLRAGRWYLVGYDVDRDEWRTFLFDRVTEVERVRGNYQGHDFPHESIGRWLATDFGRLDSRCG